MRCCLAGSATVAAAVGAVLIFYPYAVVPCEQAIANAHLARFLPGARPHSLSSGESMPQVSVAPAVQAAAHVVRASATAASEDARRAAVLATCTPPKRLRLVVGVITAPNNFDRRMWIRQKLRVSEARCRGVRVLFVLGARNHMSRDARVAVQHEQQAHGDIIFVLVSAAFLILFHVWP